MISVIVPVFKVEQYIERCIDSILSQSYNDFELILVDDGSPDNCGKICDEYKEKDRRVKVIHKINGGVSSARNAALKIASGDYIGFVDSDDWIEPNMYEILLHLLEDNSAQIASCTFRDEPTKNEFDQTEIAIKVMSKDEAYGSIMHSKEMGGFLWNKLFQKKLITELLDETLSQNEDFVFVAQCLKNINKAVFTTDQLYHYFHNNKKRTVDYSNRELTLMDSYEKILTIYTDNMPKYKWKIRLNTLKVYLNFRGRYLLSKDNNNQLKEKINQGVKAHLMPVLKHSIGLKEKINIILTYLFPKQILRVKFYVLNRREENGYWVN